MKIIFAVFYYFLVSYDIVPSNRSDTKAPNVPAHVARF